MIGTIANSEIYIYLEDNEFSLLEEKALEGNFLSQNDNKFVPLTLGVFEGNEYNPKISADKEELNFLWYKVEFSRRRYNDVKTNVNFQEKGIYQMRVGGMGKIHIYNTPDVAEIFKIDYEILREIRERKNKAD